MKPAWIIKVREHNDNPSLAVVELYDSPLSFRHDVACDESVTNNSVVAIGNAVSQLLYVNNITLEENS